MKLLRNVAIGGWAVAFALAMAVRAEASGKHPADHEDGMEKARHHMLRHHGGLPHWMVMADRLEWREDEEFLLWDLQGWYGGDRHRLWFKSEAEYELDGSDPDRLVTGSMSESDFHEFELQALYGRAVTTYFDVLLGLRHDFEPDPATSYAVVGLHGLAPQMFEIDASLFVSDEGDLSLRLEAEYELLLTQRLVLQPRIELEASAQEVPERELGSGLSSAEGGLRLRYEVRREFAPYIGWSWERKLGATERLATAAGEEASASTLVVGLRLWY